MMTEIIEAMPNLNGMDQQQFAQARSEGVELIGPGGLTGLTKSVLETALEAELSEHLGYEQYAAAAGTAGTPATAPERRRCHRNRAGKDRGAPGSGRHV